MSKPVCKFYILNQTCKFGKNCRYSHSQRPPPEERDSASADGQNEEPVDLTVHSESNFPQNPDQTDSHGASAVNKPLTTGQNASANLPQSGAADSKNSNESFNKNRPCRYFSRGGKCHYGKNCRFSHSNRPKDRLSQDGSRFRNHQNQNKPPRFRNVEASVPQDQDQQLAADIQDVTIQDDQDVATTKAAGARTQVDQQTYTARNDDQKKAKIDVGLDLHGNKKERICRFFQANLCNRGRYCKFLHTKSTSDEKINYQIEEFDQKRKDGLDDIAQEGESKTKLIVKSLPRRQGPIRQVFTFSELEEIGATNIRENEISNMKKRFPKDKITILEESDDFFKVHVNFTPSDPDWPFDVKTFELILCVPKAYPKEILSVKLPNEQNMPETVRRYVEITIGEWLEDRHSNMMKKDRAELVFRPFLRWFDRNLEEITTEALKQLKRELVAKAAGMEFLTPAQLQAKLTSNNSESDNDSLDSLDNDDSGEDLSSDSDDDDEDSEDGENKASGLALDPEKKGTQIQLRHLQLKGNTASLILDRLKVVLQCGRCKTHTDVHVPQSKVVNIACIKCNQNQYVHFRAALAHQFSSVVGYLDLDGCQAFDLILQDCRAVITCMGCSKYTRIEGLVSGQMINGWCQACNAKFNVATEAVKFSQLASSGVNIDNGNHQKVDVAKPKRLPKDPAIKEGYPLPEFGTCKHYKHSYRWLRFPCCGKAYPCDVCHDKKEDHEFVFATRMICGHCCKEQNFAGSRPCNSCSQHMTKVRSAHWEGGKGCRDKISMSKNDQQKYRNMTKTQSNHKKLLQSGGKKKTKLRHA